MGNMMHRGKGSFTHVENTVFFDRTLSLKAKGIYCQIRSLENNAEWVFTIRGFATLVKDGVDAVTAGLKELEGAGYIIRARRRSENGRFLKAEEATWITLDDPAMHDAVAEELRDSSVVLATYDAGENMRGLIGVVGPTRMDYSKVAAKLSFIAAGLSKLLGGGTLPPPGLDNKLIIKGDDSDEHENK